MENKWHLDKFKFKKGNKPWNYNKQTIICLICKNHFKIPPSQIKKRKTCSITCSAKMRMLPENGFKTCSLCKKEFPNIEFKRKTIGRYGRWQPYCKKCHVIKNQKWVERNREHVRKRTRDYRRLNRIRQTGKDIGKTQRKRQYPVNEKCELCFLFKPMKLVYHHWDNYDFKKGMWICRPCHSGVHWLEKFHTSVYFDLKLKLSKSS